MALEIWLIYTSTVLVFMITPGSSHLLMISNSISYGFNRSIATAIGDLTANALQMLAAGLGLSAIIMTSQNALSIIKWVGVLYLLYIGIKMFLKKDLSNKSPSKDKVISLKSLWLQGFLTSSANPKAIIFFAALFPQFINSTNGFALQFLVLSITYIVIDGLFLSTYGLSANWLAKRLKGKANIFINKIGASFLIIAAIMLGFKSLK